MANAPVIGIRLAHHFVAWEEAFTLPDRNESDAEFDRCGTSQEESPRLDTADCGDLLVPERFHQTCDHCGQRLGVPEDRPHIGVPADPSKALQRQITCGRRHERESPDRRTAQEPNIDWPLSVPSRP